MKNKSLSTPVLAAAIAAVSSSAFAYDTDYPITGDRYEESHVFFEQHYFADNSDSDGTELQSVYFLPNKNPDSGGNSVGATYTQADTGKMENRFSRAFRPNGPENFDLPNGSGAIPADYNIVTDAKGKIIGDSWLTDTTVLGGLNYTGTYDILNRTFSTFQACSTLPTIAEIRAQSAPNCTPTTPTSLGEVAYLTCDTSNECGQLNKAVPIPAFAAAALGLGLVGITVLTGQRRKVK